MPILENLIRNNTRERTLRTQTEPRFAGPVGSSCWLVAMLVLFLPFAVSGAAVTAYRSQVQLPTYPWWPPIKHPYFRGTDNRNIYPYPMLDQLDRTSQPRTWNTVVLENDCLRLTFLPDLGGKVWEIYDKTAGRPMFYVNHVVKPALIGQCGAWVSGGIEFNTGPAGHTVSASLPVSVEILPTAPDGSRSVAVGEVERIYGTRWTVVVTLRPGRSFIEENIRIYNRTETVRPYYFWNCTAVPNTPGFRFIYPMTLGTDHGGSTFYTWPISKGKDLSRGISYQDASSIFAYGCDQDFFGSYDEDADYGVVACANHFQLPGKKAWTWGHGSYGTMHQMDLTDSDGPYNEVQTGPLLTQADVGRLDPGEVVQWKEWWWPIKGMGGFAYANRDVAANPVLTGANLDLRLLGSGTWKGCDVRVLKGGRVLAQGKCDLSPKRAAKVRFGSLVGREPLNIEVLHKNVLLASFRVPLDLPIRTEPSKPPSPETASEFIQAGWKDYLFARFMEAEKQFRKAIEKDSKSSDAFAGLAFVELDSNPAAAQTNAEMALKLDPDDARAAFVLAVIRSRSTNETAALENAWKAALDPGQAIGARALIGRLLIRKADWTAAVAALAEPGPWREDPVCRYRLALALLSRDDKGDHPRAIELLQKNLQLDPLDSSARALLWFAHSEPRGLELRPLLLDNSEALLELVVEFADLRRQAQALELLKTFQSPPRSGQPVDPILCYWRAFLNSRKDYPPTTRVADKSNRLTSIQDASTEAETAHWLKAARDCPPENVFPYHHQDVPVLEWALGRDPRDGKAALYFGHVLFALGRHAEGRRQWEQAVELGVAVPIACRALGMAALQLEQDQKQARQWLQKAIQADPADCIVARDYARVLFALADKEDSAAEKRALISQARDALQGAFAQGKGRSDFVALLAQAHNRLDDFAATARLLDSVRITIWEGAREAHDLFEQAHLTLGKAHLEAGRPEQALAEFNRALEYPANLATGKLENTREAHIHYLRGNALQAFGRKQEAIDAWRKAADEPASEGAKEEARQKAKTALQEAKAEGSE